MAPTPSRTNALARHVEAAKQLLRELEQHADIAIDVLGHEDGSEFLAVVGERDRILAQLDQVVEALSHSRSAMGSTGEQDPEITRLFSEMAAAAAAALESHSRLTSSTRAERDRLAIAMQRSNAPDVVANQYSAMANAGRPRTLSVTG